MNPFKTDADRRDFLAALKKMTMSGAIAEDDAIEKLIRQNPDFFQQPTESELKANFNATMNAEIRSRARLTNRIADFLFQPKPSEPEKTP